MRLGDLICNDEFSFNVLFRVAKYTPTDEDPDHVDILYESNKDMPDPENLYDRWICAINQGENGVVDIDIY